VLLEQLVALAGEPVGRHLTHRERNLAEAGANLLAKGRPHLDDDGMKLRVVFFALALAACASSRRSGDVDGATADATDDGDVTPIDAPAATDGPQAIDAPATPSQKARLKSLSPEDVAGTELAGEPITSKLTKAPGNNASIGGLKVTTENGWFAARPSGTENVYKIYAESFKGEAHLETIVEQAKVLVNAALGD